MTAPAVSVVVPVLDSEERLAGCLDALAQQDLDQPFEVIVVDNGSADRSAAVARAHSVRPLVLSEPRRGSYAARNAGVAAARGAVIAFTDADCVPEPGWLTGGLAALDHGADLVAGHVAGIHRAAATIWERYDRATYLDQALYVQYFSMAATANLFVRCSVLDEVGPFDASLESSGDAELTRRASSAGHRLVYAPAAVVAHWPRTTLRATWQVNRRLGAGWAVLAARGLWPGALHDPAMRPNLDVASERVAADGPRVRRRSLVFVHVVVVAARWAGRFSGATEARRRRTERSGRRTR